jgi:chemotaxis signal transduction protein
MSEAALGIGERAAALRRAFDRGFAEPLCLRTELTEDLLAIRIGTQAYVLRLAEVAGLFADRKVTPVPGGDAALIGIAGFRGAIVPVYGLHALLGLVSGPRPCRWLVIAAAAPVALAFEAFDAQLSVPPDAILPAQSASAAQSCVREFVRTPKFSGPVIHLPSVLDALKSRRGQAVPVPIKET